MKQRKKMIIKSLLPKFGIGFVFCILGFIVFSFFSPIVGSNATDIEDVEWDDTYNVFYTAIGAESYANIQVEPTADQQVFTTTTTIFYENTCPYGFDLIMGIDGEDVSLIRDDDDEYQKTIPPKTSDGPNLDNNSWGFSLDGGMSWMAFSNEMPYLELAEVMETNSEPASLDITYGIKINDRVPSGDYKTDIIYVASPKMECTAFNLKWDLDGGSPDDEYKYQDSSRVYGTWLSFRNYRPTKEGYYLVGWSNGSQTFPINNNSYNINPDNLPEITLTAIWANSYTLRWDLDGGTADDGQSYEEQTNLPFDYVITVSGRLPKKEKASFSGEWLMSYQAPDGTVLGTLNFTSDGFTNSLHAPIVVIKPLWDYKYRLYIDFAGGKDSRNNTYYTYNKSYDETIIDLTAYRPTREGYTFYGYKVDNSDMTFTGDETEANINPEYKSNVVLRAQWKNKFFDRDGGITYLQEMRPEICSSLTTPKDSATLFDTTGEHNGDTNYVPRTNLIDQRDNNSYAVAKLADGNCWMIENLRLINSDSGDYRSTGGHDLSDHGIVGDGSDDPNWIASGIMGGDGVPASSLSGFVEGNNPRAAYLDPDYGGYYTFLVVTNGFVDDNFSSANWGSGYGVTMQTPASICPNAWKTPTAYYDGDFHHLMQHYTTYDKLINGPAQFQLGGYVENGALVSKGEKGAFWGNEIWTNPADGTSAKYMGYFMFLSTNNSLADRRTGERYIGRNLRCMARTEYGY